MLSNPHQQKRFGSSVPEYHYWDAVCLVKQEFQPLCGAANCVLFIVFICPSLAKESQGVSPLINGLTLASID